jgi:hypothetical protein
MKDAAGSTVIIHDVDIVVDVKSMSPLDLLFKKHSFTRIVTRHCSPMPSPYGQFHHHCYFILVAIRHGIFLHGIKEL